MHAYNLIAGDQLASGLTITSVALEDDGTLAISLDDGTRVAARLLDDLRLADE